MKAVGITCGIGSMLVGARAAGFSVAGNVEWRKYYHAKDENGRNTFEENYPEAPFPTSLDHMSMDEIERFFGADLAMGHPECGNFSRLSGANKNRDTVMFDPADIPLFVDLVARLKPRFFVMDDLPNSFLAFPMSKYAEKLPEYDLFPEWVSNWGYGNVQKGRDRMFMVGSLKSERWAFRAGEEAHTKTVRDFIEDLGEPRAGSNVPNHDPFFLDMDCFRALNLGEYRKKSSWREVKSYFEDKRGGFTLEYPTESGRVVKRIGFLKGHWDGPSHVLTGGNAILHAKRCEPYTIRERARIQGFPDDFVFYGTVMHDGRTWNHDTSPHMVKQTGKAMPVQFCTYVAKMIAAHIQGQPWESSGSRVLRPNERVDEAKRWYCTNVGYSDQWRACSECWLFRRCSIRTEKYGIGPAIPETRVRITQTDVIEGAIPPRSSPPKKERVAKPPKEDKTKRVRPVREYAPVKTEIIKL